MKVFVDRISWKSSAFRARNLFVDSIVFIVRLIYWHTRSRRDIAGRSISTSDVTLVPTQLQLRYINNLLDVDE